MNEITLKCDCCGKETEEDHSNTVQFLCKECAEGKSAEIDHELTEEVVCPYCGHEHTDSWEYTGDSGKTDCEECTEEFEYCRNIEVTYSTQKTEKA